MKWPSLRQASESASTEYHQILHQAEWKESVWGRGKSWRWRNISSNDNRLYITLENYALLIKSCLQRKVTSGWTHLGYIDDNEQDTTKDLEFASRVRARNTANPGTANYSCNKTNMTCAEVHTSILSLGIVF